MTSLLPFLDEETGDTVQRRIFSTRTDVVRSQRSGKRMLVDRIFVRDWVNVVACRGEDVVMVRQWRHGSRAFSLEFPAGVMEAGESPAEAGLRELREETGCTPAPGTSTIVLPAFRPNPAMMDNRCTTLWVPNVDVTEALSLDEYEEIEVLWVPFADIGGLIDSGAIDSAGSLASFLLASRVRASQ
jgi:ADP-ribose pyrophosphatase